MKTAPLPALLLIAAASWAGPDRVAPNPDPDHTKPWLPTSICSYVGFGLGYGMGDGVNDIEQGLEAMGGSPTRVIGRESWRFGTAVLWSIGRRFSSGCDLSVAPHSLAVGSGVSGLSANSAIGFSMLYLDIELPISYTIATEPFPISVYVAPLLAFSLADARIESKTESLDATWTVDREELPAGTLGATIGTHAQLRRWNGRVRVGLRCSIVVQQLEGYWTDEPSVLSIFTPQVVLGYAFR